MGINKPYRPNLWFSIEKPVEQWTSTPVFWFELTPDNWSYGMGYWQAKPQTMASFRAGVDENPKKFEKLISPLTRQDEFILDGDEYVRRKESTAKLSELAAAWYNKKGFSLTHVQNNGDELFAADLVDRLVSGYEFLMPFYDYFVVIE